MTDNRVQGGTETFMMNQDQVNSTRGRSKMTSPGKGGREVRVNNNGFVFTVTVEGGRCGNGNFCGDIIFVNYP